MKKLLLLLSIFPVTLFSQLPSRVNNAESTYFRTIFNQKNQECTHAAGIAYIFSYEMNAARGTDGNTNEHKYPTHFTYNYQNNGKGSTASDAVNGVYDIAIDHGIPNMITYGGSNNALGVTGWMNGYDKYYEAMQNRASDYFRFVLKTEDQLNRIKSWLHDREGTTPGNGGLIVANSFTKSWKYGTIAEGKHEAGKAVCYTKNMVLSGGHTFTLVGYDDDIEFDVNGDGVINTSTSNLKTLEKGAFIMANSWGPNWKNNGYVYYMYQVAATFKNAIYGLHVLPDYTPKLTIKASIECNRRKKINIKAGIANGKDATAPEYLKTFAAFNIKKGGLIPIVNTGDNSPIELGLDISDLIDSVADINNATVFLQIKADNDDALTGKVVSLSCMSYLSGPTAKEISSSQTNVTISKGNTINVPVQLNNITYTTSDISVPEKIMYTDNKLLFSENLLGAELSLIDLNGRILKKCPIDGLSMNISSGSLSSGIYIVQVNQNNSFHTKKIVL